MSHLTLRNPEWKMVKVNDASGSTMATYQFNCNNHSHIMHLYGSHDLAVMVLSFLKNEVQKFEYDGDSEE